jgi:DNA-binding NtrC family response regulator
VDYREHGPPEYLRGVDMLLVSDDVTTDRVLCGALESHGHRVISCSTMASSFDVLSRHGEMFDVIMIDIRNANGLCDDIERYARWLAKRAEVIVVRDGAIGVVSLLDRTVTERAATEPAL